MTFSSLLSIRSHPMRVRGLKPQEAQTDALKALSHPMRVRGLKLRTQEQTFLAQMSHPMRVRGLKLKPWVFLWIIFCRTPCGCVD